MDWANCKMRRETLKFWDLVHHILEVWWYIYISWSWLAKGFGNQWSGQLLRYHPMSWIPTCCLLNNGLRVYTRVLHNASFRGSHHGHNGWIGTIMTLISLANWSLMCVTLRTSKLHIPDYIDGLVQERCNSSALAMELYLSCTNPSICAKKLSVYNGCLWTVIPLTSLANQFPHLAIAVSPRLEVESSGHAWLDGCNFQRKQLLAPTEYRQRCAENSGAADENIV